MIKFCSWEAHFIKRINSTREKELSQLKAKKYLDAGCVYFWASTPILMSVSTFITYVLLGNKLTPSKVFTSLALFNMLISPLNAFPWVINGLVQAWVSMSRLQNFLNLENLNWFNYYTFNESPTASCSPQGSSQSQSRNELLLDIRDGEFSWKNEKKKLPSSAPDQNLLETQYKKELSLNEINVNIRKGDLVGVIGKVGAGKTSLLHTIIAEIEKVEGKVRMLPDECVNGFAYVGQESWIRAGTIRENILFGAEMDLEHYKRVLDACALNTDIELFPRKDETPVGENGICLSGGQKARLTLARACYAMDKDIYVLDDPFSAVDSHVAKHLFKSCINGLLSKKTRILCTHHFRYLINADLVIVMENGRIVQSGRGADIVPKFMHNLNMTELVKSDSVSIKDELITSVGNEATSQEERETEETDFFKKLDEAEMKRKEEEEKEHGVIEYKVYKYYCLAVGVCLSVLTIVFLVMMQGKSLFLFLNFISSILR